MTRVRVTVPMRNYTVSGIILLEQRTGRLYEVSETADTGAINFMDNPERAERKGREPHRGEEILARIADYLTRQPEAAEAESPDRPQAATGICRARYSRPAGAVGVDTQLILSRLNEKARGPVLSFDNT